mgnify:CR=1 FL=1
MVRSAFAFAFQALEAQYRSVLDAGYEIYEYACHEGNYGLQNILRGARANTTAAARPADPSAREPLRDTPCVGGGHVPLGQDDIGAHDVLGIKSHWGLLGVVNIGRCRHCPLV